MATQMALNVVDDRAKQRQECGTGIKTDERAERGGKAFRRVANILECVICTVKFSLQKIITKVAF